MTQSISITSLEDRQALLNKCRLQPFRSLSIAEMAFKFANIDDDGKGVVRDSDLPPLLQSRNGAPTWVKLARRTFHLNLERSGSDLVYKFDGWLRPLSPEPEKKTSHLPFILGVIAAGAGLAALTKPSPSVRVQEDEPTNEEQSIETEEKTTAKT